MSTKIRVLAGALCLFALAAAAPAQITSVSPQTFSFGAPEEYLSIRGTGLEGSLSTTVVFDGVLQFDAIFATSTEVIAFVPPDLLLVAGQHTVEVIATDVTGAVRRFGPATFTVLPAPVELRPLLYLPEGIGEEATSRSGAVVSFDATATDPNGDVPVSCNWPSGSEFPMGVTRVTCSATNGAGTVSGEFLVFIGDTTLPVMTVPADITSVTPEVTFTVTAEDSVDGNLPVTCTPPSGSSFPVGNTLVVCTATDSHNNIAFGVFLVTVTDGAPGLSLPGDITEEATGPGGAVVDYVATATGGTISCSPASGSTFPLGSTVVNCSATNPVGTSTGSFLVSVVDTTPPSLPVTNRVVEATSANGAVVNFTVTSVDLVDGNITPVCSHASGVFPIGVTEVTCEASDTRGNVAAASFFVTVQDTTRPHILLSVALPFVLWPDDHRMVTVGVFVLAFDKVDHHPMYRIVDVSSNQPVSGTGPGDRSPDWNITGPYTVELRAERAGTQDRVYTITVEVVDDSGNAAQDTIKVYVSNPRRRSS